MADTEFRRVGGLWTFPLEIALRILVNLDVDDVWIMRQVSKFWASASKTRSLWISLYYTHYANLMPRSPILEEKLDSYTDQELEEFVLRRIDQFQLWNALNDYSMCSKHKFTLPTPSRVLQLIRGGRWLLTCTEDESAIEVRDLDAADVKPQILCRALQTQPSNPVGEPVKPVGESVIIENIVVDVDDKAPTLHFNICMRTVTESSPLRHSFQIWKVRLLGHGEEAKLEAQHLSTIDAPWLHSAPTVLSLNKEHIIFDSPYERSDEAHTASVVLSVINWKQSTSTHVSAGFVEVVLSGRSFVDLRTVSLLPNNKLICIDCYKALLFEVPEFHLLSRDKSHLKLPEKTGKPLWQLDPPNGAREFGNITAPFQVRCQPNTTKMLFTSMDQGLYELTFESGDIEQQPKFAMITGFPVSSEYSWDAGLVTPRIVLASRFTRPEGYSAFYHILKPGKGNSAGVTGSVSDVSSDDEWDHLEPLPFSLYSQDDCDYNDDFGPHPFDPFETADFLYDDDSGRLLMAEFHEEGDRMNVHVFEKLLR